MRTPFIGTEALAAGDVTRGALRWNYTAVHPNVYFPRDTRLDMHDKATAAWLWTGRTGVIAGRTAAFLAGVELVEDTAPVEMIAKVRRSQPGVIARNERISDDEVATIGALPITTPARTALDLARWLPRDEAVVHLDVLSEVTDVTAEDVAPLASRYRGARGTGSASAAIQLMDGGSHSRDDTLLRLRLVHAGLPRPRTNIFLRDHLWSANVGMGWPEAKVGVECADGRRNRLHQVQFHELLQRLGWQFFQSLPQRPPTDIIYRCRTALHRRNALY